MSNSGRDTLIGNMLSLFSAFMYGVYSTFLKKRIPDETGISMPMFFGFVGLFNFLLLWPLFFVLHFTGIESFEFPAWKTLLFLLVNGLCGTFISDLLWATAVVLTSPTTTVVGISLSIPLAIMADVLLRHKTDALNLAYIGGTACVILGFVIANVSYYLPEKLKKLDQPFFCNFHYWRNRIAGQREQNHRHDENEL